jgi:hypothetical protein
MLCCNSHLDDFGQKLGEERKDVQSHSGITAVRSIRESVVCLAATGSHMSLDFKWPSTFITTIS